MFTLGSRLSMRETGRMVYYVMYNSLFGITRIKCGDLNLLRWRWIEGEQKEKLDQGEQNDSNGGIKDRCTVTCGDAEYQRNRRRKLQKQVRDDFMRWRSTANLSRVRNKPRKNSSSDSEKRQAKCHTDVLQYNFEGGTRKITGSENLETDLSIFENEDPFHELFSNTTLGNDPVLDTLGDDAVLDEYGLLSISMEPRLELRDITKKKNDKLKIHMATGLDSTTTCIGSYRKNNTYVSESEVASVNSERSTTTDPYSEADRTNIEAQYDKSNQQRRIQRSLTVEPLHSSDEEQMAKRADAVNRVAEYPVATFNGGTSASSQFEDGSLSSTIDFKTMARELTRKKTNQMTIEVLLANNKLDLGSENASVYITVDEADTMYDVQQQIAAKILLSSNRIRQEGCELGTDLENSLENGSLYYGEKSDRSEKKKKQRKKETGGILL